MKIQLATLALLAGLFASAAAQANQAEITRLQKEIAVNQAKGDYKTVEIEQHLLARQYKSDPAMLSITYQQLAQTASQLHDEKKAADYRAQAQKAMSQPAAAPVSAPQAPAPAPAYAPQQAAAGGGAPAPAGTPAAKPASTDKFEKILAEAAQIMAQAEAMKAAKKQKAANAPPPGQPMPPPPEGGFQPVPEGAGTASAPSPQAAPAAGVVIGYDANNQPIFASAPPPAPVAAGVVIGYDANNKPIFAPAAPPR